jgi:PIN domain nuclease of toxin-antitoxin system
MILLDTCVLIFDALTPERLSKPATDALNKGEERDELACSSISLWEIALLIAKGRLKPGKDALVFIRAVLLARHIQVMEITPEIAVISAKAELFEHADPADRIIGATALFHKMTLITSDGYLAKVKGLSVVW